MIILALVLFGTAALLYLWARAVGVKQKLLGLNVHFAVWNIALFFAVVVMTVTTVGVPRHTLVLGAVLVSIADAIWAGLAARAEDRGIKRGRQQPGGGGLRGSQGRGASPSG